VKALLTHSSLNRLRDTALVTCFFALPAAIAVESFVPMDPFRHLKNANAGPEVAENGRSAWELAPRRMESRYFEHIGFRNLLTRLHSWILVRVLRDSPLEDVSVGREGWLYYHPKGLDDVLMSEDCPDEHAVAQRAALFTRWNDWFASQGLPYLLVIVPSKSRVYPEYLPARLQGFPFCPAFDAVVQRLKDEGKVSVVTLAEPMARARATSDEALFGPSDTHWRCPGSYVGYREILAGLSGQGLAARPLERTAVHGWDYDEGDLARMLMLHGLYPEHEGDCKANQPLASSVQDPEPRYTTIRSEQTNAALPRLFVLGDSTMSGPIYLLAEHFSQGRFVRKENFSVQRVIDFDPDYVVHLVGDRVLFAGDVLPPPPPLPGLEHRFGLGTPLLTLSAGAPELTHGLRVQTSAAGWRVEVTGDDPYFVLRRLAGVEGRPVIAKLELETAADTRLQLFYAAGTGEFVEERSVLQPLKAGRRTVYLEVPGAPDLWTRFDIGDNLKEFTVRSLAIVSAPAE
jgi:hypothetical protein